MSTNPETPCRLRDLATAPAGGITQPRTNFFGQLCISSIQNSEQKLLPALSHHNITAVEGTLILIATFCGETDPIMNYMYWNSILDLLSANMCHKYPGLFIAWVWQRYLSAWTSLYRQMQFHFWTLPIGSYVAVGHGPQKCPFSVLNYHLINYQSH